MAKDHLPFGVAFKYGENSGSGVSGLPGPMPGRTSKQLPQYPRRNETLVTKVEHELLCGPPVLERQPETSGSIQCVELCHSDLCLF